LSELMVLQCPTGVIKEEERGLKLVGSDEARTHKRHGRRVTRRWGQKKKVGGGKRGGKRKIWAAAGEE